MVQYPVFRVKRGNKKKQTPRPTKRSFPPWKVKRSGCENSKKRKNLGCGG